MFRWLASIIIFVLTLAAIEHYLGFQLLITSLSSIALPHVALWFLLMVFSYFMRAWRIKIALALPALSFSLFHLSITHILLNILLPMRTGEAAFPLLMKKHYAIEMIKSTSYLILFRLLDLFCLLAITAVFILGIYNPYLVPLGVIVLVSSLLLLNTIKILLITLCEWSNATWIQALSRHLVSLPTVGMTYYKIIGVTFLVWLSKIIAFVLVVMTAVNIGLLEALLGILAAELSSILPIHGIAGTGTFEGAFVLAGSLVQKHTETLLQASVQLHLLVIATALVVYLFSAMLSIMLNAYHRKNARSIK